MRAGLDMLINISYVDDTEVFKSCLDYWQLFVAEIFASCTSHAGAPGEDEPGPMRQFSVESDGRTSTVNVCECFCLSWYVLLGHGMAPHL